MRPPGASPSVPHEAPCPDDSPEGAARPLRADAARNRERILAAAAEVFAAQGLGAGLDEIARHAGVGTGTVYRRFPDKPALIDALFAQRFDALEALAREGLETEDAWEGFVHYLAGAVAMQVGDRALNELLFSDTHANARIARGRDRLAPLVERLLARAQAAGEVRDDLALTDVPLLMFMLVGAGALTADVAPEAWRRALGVVLEGVRPRGRERLAPDPLTRPQLGQAIAAAGRRRAR